jgi:histone-lysine N-methyltransferase SETMAR
LGNRRRALLQQDNASPHTARKTKQKLRELDATELAPHPAYSPHLAPSEFNRFRAMAYFVRGRSFKTIEDVEMGCREIFPQRTRRGIAVESNCSPKDGFTP